MNVISWETGAGVEAFRWWQRNWLQCFWDERDELWQYHAMESHAVVMKCVESEGAAVYMAAHVGKQKEDQLGWQGKQWGIINRGLFVRREPVEYVLNGRQGEKFRKTMQGLLLLRRERRLIIENRKRVANGEEPLQVFTSKLPRAVNWQRCCDAENVERLLRWAKAQEE